MYCSWIQSIQTGWDIAYYKKQNSFNKYNYIYTTLSINIIIYPKLKYENRNFVINYDYI